MAFDVEEYAKKRRQNKSTDSENNGSSNSGFDVENYVKQRNLPKVSEYLTSSINSWLKKNESFVNSYNSRYSGENTTYRADASDWLSSVATQKSSLAKEADSIRNILDQYKDYLDKDYYMSVTQALDGNLKMQGDILSASTKDYEFWSKFESEDDYKRWSSDWLNTEGETSAEKVAQRQEIYQSNKDRIAEIEKTVGTNGFSEFFGGLGAEWNALLQGDQSIKDNYYGLIEEKEALEAENLKYERTQGKMDSHYIPITNEVEQIASNRSFSNATSDDLWNYDAVVKDISARNLAYDYNGNMVDAGGNIVYDANHPIVKAMRENNLDGFYDSVIEDKLGMYLSASQDDLDMAYERLIGGGNADDTWAILLNEGEVNAWKELEPEEITLYYYKLNAEGQASAYKFLEDMTTELTRRATQERADEINQVPVLKQIFLNAASIPMNVLGGAVGLVGDVANALEGKEYNPYSAAHSWSNDASAIRQDTAQDINNATGNAALPWVGTTFGDVYQSIMSAGDSVMTSFIPGGHALLGLNAASAEMKDLYERGASTEQMLAGGILAGAAESFFEKYSIGELNKIKNMDTKAVKSLSDWFVRTAIMGGVEASEEMATEIANTISDALVMGSQSNWVDFETFAKNVINAGIGGFISGGLMGGVASAVNNAQYQNQVKQHGQNVIDQGGVEALQATASEMADNKAVTKLSNKVANKATAKNVGRLATTIQNITNAKDRATIATDLESNGLSKQEAQKVADFTVKISQGYEPTSTEIAEIERITDKLPDVAEDVADNNVGNKTSEVTQTSELPSSVEQASAQAEETAPVTENTHVTETATESEIEAPEGVSEKAITIEEASQKYGAQAQAMIHTYTEGQNVAEYDKAYGSAYNMGMSGVSIDYAKNSDSTAYLTETQRELAYEAGRAAADISAKEQYAKIKANANGNTGRRKGVVKGEGVTIADLKASFNDTQNIAYKVLSTYAEATGVDIVLYKSEADAEGNFIGSQGKFKWSEDKIYIDVNAGLSKLKDVNDLAKYAMIRTYSHEFTHFVEKYNPMWYNELRTAVFDALTERGENVHDLIEQKQMKTEGMTYEKASREVIAEAMTDILPDATFVETLANKHKNIFDKVLDKLKEFLADLKAYFETIGHNPSREANALKEQVGEAVHYVDNIVKLFDKVALEAVENYQSTVAFEEKAEKIDSTVTKKAENISNETENKPKTEKSVDTAVDETVTEATNEVDENSEGDSFTITDNAEYGTLEIKFDGKPSEAVRNVLKEHKFRWHKQKGIWYGKAERTDIVKALREAYQSQNNISEGDIANGTEQAEEKLTPDRGTESGTLEIQGATRTEDEDRSRVQSDVGEKREDNGGTFTSAQGSLEVSDDNSEIPFDASDIVQIAQDNVLYEPQQKLINEYGIECYIIESGAWVKKGPPAPEGKTQAPTGTYKGRVYISEDFSGDFSEDYPRDLVATTAPHESTHAIGQLKYQPYLDFIDKIPNMLDFSSAYIERLINWISVHCGVDFFSMSMSEALHFYDEMNAAIYGFYKTDLFEKYGYSEWIPNAFYDFDSYIAELEAIHEQYKKEHGNTEEVNQNGENADNGQTVLGSDPDGERAPRSLDEQQAEDVSGTASERNAVEDTQQRESEVGRDGDRADTADRLGRSEGNSERGNLRELTETVEREIEQKSTEQPKGNNFVIGDSLNLPNGEKARFRANVDAIRLIKQLEAEDRFATASEQEILSKYVGWGGLSNAFGDLVFNRETRKTEMVPKDEWKAEFAELKSLIDEGVITEQEYKTMSASTKNAHYTSVEVIKAMYDGLAGLGFKGGRMLEPSSGVGNFVGAMPTDMSAKVNSWTMVEIERVTGLIAKYLYPNSDVRIQGFENANIPDNYMDVAIGNVPFGEFGVVDRTYPKRITKSIHNYFFAKSIDKVRPGGIVMFITSSFTMNAKDSTVRQYIMERADLLGAIRLPNTAFKGNAGTEVVTDILILKKREAGTEYAGEDFLEADYDYNYGTYTSNYFRNHPEMVLGKPVTKRGMYGASTLTFEPFTDRGTIDDQIREAFKNIKGKMDYPTKLSPEKTNFAVEKATKKAKSGGFVVNSDGSISRNENGQLVKYDTDEKTAKRIAGILSIRDAYKTLANYLQQGQDAKYIKQARTALNKAYDTFVKEYGLLNSPANKKAIDSDPDRYSILSLENYDAKKKTATKADIFTKDTISANKSITHVDSVEEGVIASINLTGGVDTALIAKLTDKTVDDVTREVIDSRLAFKTRNNGLVARETYLSGNVRAKLREAESLAPYDQDFNNNIEELNKVIPADIPYNEIYITPGNAFIPNEVYADFIAHMLGGRNNPNSYSGPDVEVGRTASGEFKIILNNKRLKSNYYNTQTWGTARKSFLELIDAMMGSRTVKVNDTIEGPDGKKVSVVNEAETEAANEKVKAIQQEFEDWIWKDEDRRTALARLYNETFNAIVNPKYDGSHLSVNGINADYSLRPHQANAVHRIISSGGNTLLAHRVGAGKTLEMAAAAMKMRELGVIKKPVFVVPKNVVAQWGVEFHSYFPAARLLVADDKSFTPANRKIFTNQIANGDYDAVIVSYEQFEKIPMSVEYQQRFYEEQIDDIINAIAEEKAESRDGKGLTVKEMEKKKAQLEKKLKELTSKPKDENNVDFEMLGIDSLFVDEAHNFKNLEYVSKMSNVAGLGPSKGAQRAFDLYTKIRYLQGLNGGRGIVFATATPVMNSMVELYIMQRYLQPDVLNQLGLKSFDAWAKQFGEVVNKWEINPSGTGMRQKQVFANFRNLNELQLLFRSFADVLTEVPGLKIPKMKGGAVKIVECEPGEFQKNYMQQLQKRAENVKNVDPTEDNMLKITSDGRKVSYTQRMIDPTLPYEPESKIFKAAENVLKEYRDSADIKGTQIVFLDMATPKGTDKSKTETDAEDSVDEAYDEESARLYDDMRDYLVKKGIPKREIAFIHEANSDAKRKQLFEDVNSGKVRVLMGSTGKMGVGMNAQKRVVAIHHLDAPWRPGDVEQRDGRAFRQKNINEEVSKYVYVTKGSFDSRLWDILDRKQHFINQIMNGEDVGRTAEDTGEVTLSAAEVKALASGNPLIEEQTKLTDAIKKLENLQKAYNSSIVLARTKLSDDEVKITNYTNRIARIREDIKARVDTYSDDKFSMTVGKQVFKDKKDAGVALAAEIVAKANADSYSTVGKFAGFELKVIKSGSEYSALIHGKEGYKFNVYLNNTTRMVNHIGEIIAGFENIIKNSEQMISDLTADRDAQKNILAQPFEKQEELAQKRARFNEVMELLSPKTEQQHSKIDDDTVQEQSREYLDEQHQQRTDTLTDREVLEMAANEVKVSDLTKAETDALTIFQDRLSKLKDLQDERTEQGRLYKEQQFGEKVDRAKAEETLNRMHILDDQIKKATAEVLTVEEKEVLKRVLSKARKVVEAQEREHGKEILNRWRDRRNNAAAIKKYRDRLRGDVDELSNWILHPNNKDTVKHVPDVLKNSVIPFLSSINFMSKRALNGGAATKADEAFMDNLRRLNSALKINIDVNGLYSGYSDLPPNFMENLQRFIDSTEAIIKKNSGELVINQMTSAELKDLSSIVRTLKKYIMQVNRFHYNAMYEHVYEAAENSIEHLTELGNAGNTSALSEFVLWQQIRPAYAFERFGNGGIAIYDGLRRGQAKLAFNTQEIQKFTEKAYTEKEVKAWEEDIKTFRFGSDIVKIPVSYLMGFYELSKDPEALVHINGEGIRVATYTHKGKKISDRGHILTVGEFNQLIGSLTDRQKEVADSLQKYMATQGAKWGNYVSVARFGEELFTNPKYYPINSDGRHLQAMTDEHPSAAALYALLNMSFTKSRQEGANNRIMIYSIFDVFANHMASMAQYNAMALPILDALKWFNYQQVFVDDEGNKQKGESVRERMDRAYGVPEETRPGRGKSGYAQNFVMNIIKAFNGTEAQGTPYDSIGLKSLHRYNIAQVAYNLRVVVQQPLAITRAALLLDYGSIRKGMKLKPSEIKKNIEEMQKYSGIAAWKALGFYDVNVSRGLTHIIKHDSTFIDKVSDVGMWGAEKADTLTWAAIWSACKEEVRKKEHLTPESDGFYEAVTKLFEDVIYKTQVVDSILTKNEFMRDKGAFARLVGSFMSEPTTNASMLIDAYDKYALDIQRGMTRKQAWQKNSKMIGRTLYVYAVGAILLAAVQAAADALRDDDDYEEWYEKWLEAFGGNLVDELLPFNKLPILSDFYDLAKELLSIVGVDTYGNPPQSVFMQWYDSLVKGTEIIYQKIVGEDTNYTWYGGIYKLLQAASGISGLPMASATREIITAWNNTVGAMAPSLKIKDYEPSELSQIKYAYEDGYLTYEEATAQLLEQGLADNENDAYFIMQGWEAGDNYSRYDAIYDAVRNGAGIDEAMAELTSHGYTEEEVLSQVKTKIGKWYKDGEISKQQATNMLTKYFGMDSNEINATLSYWEYKAANPDADVYVDWFEKYYSDVSASGMSLNEYLSYKNKVKDITGEDKKARRMAVINSLPITNAQKDALYYAEGWAASKLYEAPWY